MSDLRMDITTGIGIAGAGAGILAAVTGRRKVALVAAVGAAVAAAAARRDAQAAADLERRVASMNEQIRQLENAVAAQVQSRMVAEEAVKSLSGQLTDAERRAGDTSMPLIISDDGTSSEGLTDSETGLFNHDYFLVALDSRIAAARRHLRPVAVALLDIVEGREGDARPSADARMIANALRETLRESDTATRLHDGRFGVVLEDTPENGAIWTMERLRRRLAEDNPDLTLWAGVACYPAHAFDVGALIDRADAALESAREWHQDRIEVATAD
ncbi:MAG: GGDEF domain-containing protein [Acidimicrobiales bacterium]|nr:GGDEF domain-containing protein [Acidimicrobiales bacterium]